MNERLIKEECDTCIIREDKLEGCEQGVVEEKTEIEGEKGRGKSDFERLHQLMWGSMSPREAE